jgi:hypothetical protein
MGPVKSRASFTRMRRHPDMAATKKSTTKKSAPKKGASKGGGKGAKPKAKAKSKAESKASPKAPAGKAGAPKINDVQRDLLTRVHGAGEAGHSPAKGEMRTMTALVTRKLVKRGAKNKDTGAYAYTLTKAGMKHVGTGAGAATAAESAPAPTA